MLAARREHAITMVTTLLGDGSQQVQGSTPTATLPTMRQHHADNAHHISPARMTY
jgi:hypothetical protein